HHMSLPATLLYSAVRCFSFNHPAPTEIYTLSLHDALPIWRPEGLESLRDGRAGEGHAHSGDRVRRTGLDRRRRSPAETGVRDARSEEHTSELQSRENLVCRLLLEKKKNTNTSTINKHRVRS